MDKATIVIDKNLKDRLKKEAKKRRMTLSGMIELVLEGFLKEKKFVTKLTGV